MAEYDYIDIHLADKLFIARKEIVRLSDEIERLRRCIDALEQLSMVSGSTKGAYEVMCCPICHRATESRFWSPVESHADGCPWREARRG